MKSSESPQVAEGRGQNLTDGVSGQRQMQQAGHVGKVLPPDSWVSVEGGKIYTYMYFRTYLGCKHKRRPKDMVNQHEI